MILRHKHVFNCKVNAVCSRLQKPVDNLSNRPIQTEASEPADGEQFNSFQFWREPLPSVDSNLLELLVSLTETGSARSLVYSNVTE